MRIMRRIYTIEYIVLVVYLELIYIKIMNFIKNSFKKLFGKQEEEAPSKSEA
jgi:hypothetical protein